MRQHAAEFTEREAKLEAAQRAASRFTEREQHLAQREREVSSREDEVQAASAAADLVKAEAEALWRKSKVSSEAFSQPRVNAQVQELTRPGAEAEAMWRASKASMGEHKLGVPQGFQRGFLAERLRHRSHIMQTCIATGAAFLSWSMDHGAWIFRDPCSTSIHGWWSILVEHPGGASMMVAYPCCLCGHVSGTPPCPSLTCVLLCWTGLIAKVRLQQRLVCLTCTTSWCSQLQSAEPAEEATIHCPQSFQASPFLVNLPQAHNIAQCPAAAQSSHCYGAL